MLLPFPQELPFEAINLLIDKIRGKSVSMTTAVNAAWNLAGYAATQVLPEHKVIGASEDVSPEEAVKILESLLPTADGSPVNMVVIPWFVIVKICIKFLVNVF